LKKTLYDAIIPRWNNWTNYFPLHIDQILMRDKLWVILEPSVPDHDAIAKHFFKPGKKGTPTFKSGKTLIHFHVLNEIYDAMLEKRDSDELIAGKKAMVRKVAERNVVMRDKETEQSIATDFTVGDSTCLQTLSY